MVVAASAIATAAVLSAAGPTADARGLRPAGPAGGSPTTAGTPATVAPSPSSPAVGACGRPAGASPVVKVTEVKLGVPVVGCLAISAIVAVRFLIARILLARDCTENMGYQLGIDGATMTTAGCAVDRGGEIVVVPGLALWPFWLILFAAVGYAVLACLPLTGRVLGPALLPAGATAASVILCACGVWWWRTAAAQLAFCRDALGGNVADWAYCQVGERGTVPMLPSWPPLAAFAAAVMALGASGAWTLRAARRPGRAAP